ncbi:MAG: lysylphosphatidylglycerol synthase domain-containing protein [Kiloniellaceae bacterium]
MLAPAVLCIGLLAVVGFIAWQGAGQVGAIAGRLGWGVAWLPVLYVVSLTLAALSWRCLFPAPSAPRLRTLIKAMWIGRSVNGLLPSGGVTGEVVRARLLMGSGHPGRAVGASLVLDKTVQALAIVVQGAAAGAVLPLLGAPSKVVFAAVAGWALLALGVLGFVLVQRAGMFSALTRGAAAALRHRRCRTLIERARRLDAAVRGLHRHAGRIAWACVLRLGFRFALVAELWLISVLVQHPIGVLDAFMIEGLSAVLRGAAFIVPGALGVQEGSYMALGAIVGLDPALMLALALSKRAREVMVGLPGLMAWQAAEGRSFLRGLGGIGLPHWRRGSVRSSRSVSPRRPCQGRRR